MLQSLNQCSVNPDKKLDPYLTLYTRINSKQDPPPKKKTPQKDEGEGETLLEENNVI